MSTLVSEIAITVEKYNNLKDTASQKDLLEIRKNLSTSLFSLRQLAKERKKAWKGSEYYRKKAVAQAELDLVGEKIEGKSMTAADRKSKALIQAHEEYGKEVDTEAEWDEYRIMIEGIKQILNTIAAELKDYEQGN